MVVIVLDIAEDHLTDVDFDLTFAITLEDVVNGTTFNDLLTMLNGQTGIGTIGRPDYSWFVVLPPELALTHAVLLSSLVLPVSKGSPYGSHLYSRWRHYYRN